MTTRAREGQLQGGRGAATGSPSPSESPQDPRSWGPPIGGATQESPGIYVGHSSFSVFTRNTGNRDRSGR